MEKIFFTNEATLEHFMRFTVVFKIHKDEKDINSSDSDRGFSWRIRPAGRQCRAR